MLGGGWWLWWRLPKRKIDRLRLTIRDPKARADIEDNYRKTIGQLLGPLLGGAAVLIGAGLAYVQFTQQQQRSQQQFIQQQQASHDLLISNQVSKGFEQLGQPGNDKVIVRLGGIYALEGVMNISEQYHQPVLEGLSAFVRDATKTETGEGPPATDIQAALTVIGRRAAIGTGSPDLTSSHISKANLEYADLNSADLTSAQITNADLALANLTRANLRSAHLTSARLGGANLTGANLPSATVFDADLTRADLDGANLRSADLTRANLAGATISQLQLDRACGTDVKLDPGLSIKPCQD